jgi:hypothetical protein
VASESDEGLEAAMGASTDEKLMAAQQELMQLRALLDRAKQTPEHDRITLVREALAMKSLLQRLVAEVDGDAWISSELPHLSDEMVAIVSEARAMVGGAR